jgi:hypothetical protein
MSIAMGVPPCRRPRRSPAPARGWFLGPCVAALWAPIALAQATKVPEASSPTSPPAAGTLSAVPVAAPPNVTLRSSVGIRTDDRALWLEANHLLESGAAAAAQEKAKPLFDAYPDNIAVQDLRCRIAAVRLVDKDTVNAECTPYARLSASVVATSATADPAGSTPPATASSRVPAPAGPPDATKAARSPDVRRRLVVSGGPALSFQTREHGYGQGAGFLAEADYVIEMTAWVLPKLYAGILVTFPDSCEGGGTPCEVTARMAFGGAKVRLIAPIPYVAPFVDLGLGLGVGVLTTRLPDADYGQSFLAYHFSIFGGLAFGKDQNVDLAVGFLAQPSTPQSAVAFELGLSFPLH